MTGAVIFHLHSILVKSIQDCAGLAGCAHGIDLTRMECKFAQDLPDAPDRIYIPFWLNLYRVRILLGSGNAQIYIPFWLNLYSADTELGAGSYQIYIPFWLNLYVCRIGRCLMLHLFTFHSG